MRRHDANRRSGNQLITCRAGRPSAGSPAQARPSPSLLPASGCPETQRKQLRRSSIVRRNHPGGITHDRRHADRCCPLTVVLVHGAFADGSSWSGVIERLQAQGSPVIAPANPLRGIAHDSAYIASLHQPDPRPGAGRRPLLRRRGHQQCRHQRQERRRPGLRRRLRPGRGRDPGASRRPPRRTASSARPWCRSSTRPARATRRRWSSAIDPAKFHEVFAGDLPAAAGRRRWPRRSGRWPSWRSPSRTGTPAWKTLPSWAVVATGDKAAGTDVVRSMAERAGAAITEVDGSHVIMISQPQAVTDVILTAVDAVS